MAKITGKRTTGLGVVHSNNRIDVAVPAAMHRSGGPVSKGKGVEPVRNLKGGADSIPAAKPRAGRRPSVHPIF
jgi:hypothetical protein